MDRLTELRNAIFRVCADYDVDDGIRAMASALTEMIIGCTANRTDALTALDRLVPVMRAHIEDVAKPPDSAVQ